MLESEVNYRLSKWILVCMRYSEIISDEEMQLIWQKFAEDYNPPFLEVDTVGGSIGDGVSVRGR